MIRFRRAGLRGSGRLAGLFRSGGLAGLRRSSGLAGLHRGGGLAGLHRGGGLAGLHRGGGLAGLHRGGGLAGLHRGGGLAGLHRSGGLAGLHRSGGLTGLHRSLRIYGKTGIHRFLGIYRIYRKARIHNLRLAGFRRTGTTTAATDDFLYIISMGHNGLAHRQTGDDSVFAHGNNASVFHGPFMSAVIAVLNIGESFALSNIQLHGRIAACKYAGRQQAQTHDARHQQRRHSLSSMCLHFVLLSV